MNKIDIYGEVLYTYDNDKGTITLSIRNRGEDSAEITVSRDCEVDLKAIVRMIEDRNENICAMETAISEMGDAHFNEAEDLTGVTAEIYDNLNYRKWEKRYRDPADADKERKELAEKVRNLEAENLRLQQRVRIVERENDSLKRGTVKRVSRRKAA